MANKIHFVVIDDSGDLDSEIKSLTNLPDLRVVTPPFNLGHQRAIVYGLRQLHLEVGDNDIVVTLDSDGEDRPEDLPDLLDKVQQLGNINAIVIARRTKRSEAFMFKIFYFFFKAFFKLLTGTVIRSGNYASFRGETLRRFIFHPWFDLCYSSALLATKLPKVESPCARGKRYYGHSKMNLKSLIMHGIRLLMPFLDSIAVRSLIFFAATAIVGLSLGLLVLTIKVFTDLAIPGWASYSILTCLVLSVIGFGQFIIVFSLFTQITGSSLRFIDIEKTAISRKDDSISFKKTS